MPNITMMRGLPASGKSTKAKELSEKDGNSVRVNKDLLREMLHFDVWSGKNEKLTRKAQKAVAKEMLSQNKNVIVDDTNLGQKHEDSWKEFAKENNAQFSIHDMEFTDIAKLIERDGARDKSVGPDVIIQTAMRYGYWKPQNDKVVLCDIDGTIADVDHRLHYVKREEKDWNGFFSEMYLDDFRSDVWQDVVGEGYEVIFVTARPEKYRDVTMSWLSKHYIFRGFDYTTIVMRRDTDKREDSLVKKDMLDLIGKDNVHCVFDDRPRVIRMWKENDLDVRDVGTGEEF